jgi:hypothetical protein
VDEQPRDAPQRGSIAGCIIAGFCSSEFAMQRPAMISPLLIVKCQTSHVESNGSVKLPIYPLTQLGTWVIGSFDNSNSTFDMGRLTFDNRGRVEQPPILRLCSNNP